MTTEEPKGASPVTLKRTGTDRQNQFYRWFFTIKEEDYTVSQLSQILKEIAKQFTFSLESGESTGYRHYQGCFSANTKERLTTMKNHFTIGTHLEPCRDWFKAIKYCQKSETHLLGPWNENSVFVETITELRPWQQNIVDLIETKPDLRSIYWFFDRIGNKGKSVLTKYLGVHKDCLVLDTGAKKDMAYILSKYPNPKAVIFDFEREMEEKINYGAIEKVKNGMIMSAKFKSNMLVFNSPHIICFANFEPDYRTMSQDRWRVVDLNEKY